MMSEIINTIGQTVLDNGIWKFILPWIFFTIVLGLKLFKDERDIGDDLLVAALFFMWFVISFLGVCGLVVYFS